MSDEKDHKAAPGESANHASTKFVMTPLAAAVIGALSPAGIVVAQEEEAEKDSKILDEVLVTATRRQLNLQDVAQSITAFSTQDIAEMGVKTMADYVKAMPSVGLTETRPGITSLSMRGISTGSFEYRLQDQTTIYLDEQAMTTSAQNISVRAIDMERIEVLPGPQGTLFGSSSQTGTLRMITNKPDFNNFTGFVQTDFGSTAGGAESYDISGVLNVPVADNFAIRIVGYSTRDGGWVDNVLGTPYSGGFFGDDRPDDNSDVVEDDYNEYDTDGGRIQARWQISDKWLADLSFVTEATESRGEWETDPSLGGKRIVRFFEDFREDDWYTLGLTLSGDLGFADLTVTAQYMDRDFAYEWDNNAYTQRKDRTYGGAYLRAYESCYTQYAYTGYASYYCAYAGYYAGYSFAPRYYTNYAFSTIVNDQQQERDQLEVRLTSKGDGKLQWMLGGYYEEIYDTWFYYTDMPQHVNTTAWAAAQSYAYYYKYYAGYTQQQYPLPETTYHYAQLMERTNTQIAIFGEIDYDITDDTQVTVGVRWAENDREEFDRYEWPVGLPAVGGYGSGGEYGTSGKQSDTFYKLGIQHNVNDDVMLYGLFSQGFRLGGTNSPRAASSGVIPQTYNPDFMDNYEIGMKSEWADNTFQLNISAFQMNWRDYQQSIFGAGQWWIRGTTNAGGAESRGVEANFTWQATDQFRIRGSYFRANAEFTDFFLDPTDDSLEIRKGQDMPNSPDYKAWISFAYDIPDVFGADMSLYYAFSAQGETWNTTDNARDSNEFGLAPSWTYSNASASLRWPNDLSLTLRVDNAFDEDTHSYRNNSIRNYSGAFPTETRDRLNRNEGRPRTVWLSLYKGF